MPEHLFTENDQIKVDLVPPAGATAVIIRAFVKKGPEPSPGETVRLFHVRLAGHRSDAPPRETQILELIYRDGSFTAGFSGFGSGKKAMENPQNRHKLKPIHIGPVGGESFPVILTVPFSGRDAIVSPGGKTAMSDTEITPAGQPMELLLGFTGEGELKAPTGWTISWDDVGAVEWVGANGPVNPPSTPPVPPSPPIVTPPAPSAPSEGTDWKAELRHDLQQLATKYAVVTGVDPTLLLGLQLLLGMVKR